MNIEPLYQRYCFLSQRGRARDAELALDALGKAALECARQMARFRCKESLQEDVVIEATATFVRLASQRRYARMTEGLLKRIVAARAVDAHRRQRKLSSLDEVPEEVFKMTEKGYANMDLCLSIGMVDADNDPLSQISRALRFLSARELAWLIYSTEQDNTEAFHGIAQCAAVVNRLTHDRRVADYLDRLRAGEVAPNTIKQWDFQMRRRIQTAGHHLN